MWKKILKMLTNNVGLKILALVFASILWLVVININNPQTTINFTATAKILNDSTITKVDKVYRIEDNSNVISFSVTGPRTIVEGMSAKDFSIVADMTRINMETGLIPVEITADRYASQVSIDIKTNNVRVSIENMAIKQFAISTSSTGTPKNGYAIGTVSCYPATVTISGPESTIESIEKVIGTIDINDMYDDRTQTIIPTLLTADGVKVDSTYLSIEPSSVQLTAEILETKTVPLVFVYQGDIAPGYSLEKITCLPETVTVKGRRNVLSVTTKIVIPGDAIDLSKQTRGVENVIDIIPYLPEGLQLVDSDLTTAVINADIKSTVSKKFNVPVQFIEVYDLDDSYSLAFSTESVEIEVTGSQGVISGLSAGSFKLYVDFEGYGRGVFTIVPECKSIDGIDSIVVGEVSGVISEQNSDIGQNGNGGYPTDNPGDNNSDDNNDDQNGN